MAYEQLRLDNQLCFRLYTASRLVTQAYHPYLDKLGITYPQYLVLMVLWENSPQPVNDIAKTLNLETNTVTPLLQRMEKQGLLSRRKDTADARKMLVELTAEGKAMEEKARDIPLCVSSNILCENLDENSLRKLAGVLDDVIERLKK